MPAKRPVCHLCDHFANRYEDLKWWCPECWFVHHPPEQIQTKFDELEKQIVSLKDLIEPLTNRVVKLEKKVNFQRLLMDIHIPKLSSLLTECEKTDDVLKLEVNATERGFNLAVFTDHDGRKCSIQKSSSGEGDLIWLGCDDPDPKVLTDEGWKLFYIPEPNAINTRMHLTQDQVKALLPLLTCFVKEGDIE